MSCDYQKWMFTVDWPIKSELLPFTKSDIYRPIKPPPTLPRQTVSSSASDKVKLHMGSFQLPLPHRTKSLVSGFCLHWERVQTAFITNAKWLYSGNVYLSARAPAHIDVNKAPGTSFLPLFPAQCYEIRPLFPVFLRLYDVECDKKRGKLVYWRCGRCPSLVYFVE